MRQLLLFEKQRPAVCALHAVFNPHCAHPLPASTPAELQADFIDVFTEDTASIWQNIYDNPDSLGNLSVSVFTNFSGPRFTYPVWNTSWSSTNQMPACFNGSCGNATMGMGALWQVRQYSGCRGKP